MDNKIIDEIGEMIEYYMGLRGLEHDGRVLSSAVTSELRRRMNLRQRGNRVPDDVRCSIRSRWTGGNTSELCERYGVSRATLYRIVSD